MIKILLKSVFYVSFSRFSSGLTIRVSRRVHTLTEVFMKELLYTIVEELVEDKSAINIIEDQPNEEGVIIFHLNVAPDDMGRVIGKQGKIAKAIRTIMRAGAIRKNLKVTVEID